MTRFHWQGGQGTTLDYLFTFIRRTNEMHYINYKNEQKSLGSSLWTIALIAITTLQP